MTAAAFYHETAYADSWRHRPAVRDGRLTLRSADGTTDPPYWPVKVERGDAVSGDWNSVASAAFAETQATVWLLWPTVASQPAPPLDSELLIDGVTWLVRGVTEGRYGARYSITAIRQNNG